MTKLGTKPAPASLAASGRTLQDVPAPAPTEAAGDAIVAIVDPKGVTTAIFPVVDGSDLKVLPKPSSCAQLEVVWQQIYYMAAKPGAHFTDMQHSKQAHMYSS